MERWSEGESGVTAKRYIPSAMFPYRDDNPTILTPFVTVGLIAANLAIWIVLQGAGNEQRLAATVCELGLTPGDLLHRLPIGYTIPVGEGLGCVIDGGSAWYTVLTSMFLHGGWLHVLGNMWFLWLFGNNVEDAMGHVRFLIFYLLCGVAAAAAQVLSAPDSPVAMVGASGAISGIMGAYVVLYPRVRVYCVIWLIFIFRFAVPAWLMLGYWLFLQIAGAGMDQVGGVAVFAHIGGFIAGALLIPLFKNRELLARRDRVLAARAWEVHPA